MLIFVIFPNSFVIITIFSEIFVNSGQKLPKSLSLSGKQLFFSDVKGGLPFGKPPIFYQTARVHSVTSRPGTIQTS